MAWFGRRGKRRRDPEIAPDEIFLDASNIPDFNKNSLEGSLEKPLSRGAYLGLGIACALLLLVVFGQAWHLQVLDGATYARASERNVLEPQVLFASRGAILDTNGIPLVKNVEGDGDSVTRSYMTPGFSELLGYVSSPKKDSSGKYYDTEMKGLAGIEKSMDDQLAGKNGTLLVEEDARGAVQSQGVVDPAVPGQNVTLSIDARAQTAFFDAIRDVADMVPFQGGAGIIMDAQTGAVIAMTSYPEYDSNVMSAGSPADAISGYLNDPRQPFLDRPVSGLYTPGSVIKPLEAAGALTDGTISADYTINDIGYLSIPNPYDPAHPNIFKDWKAIGVEDMRKAIAYSSDVYFYTVGGGYGNQKGLGIDRLDQWYQTFGLTSPTGIDMPNENSGFVPTPAWKQQTFQEAWNIGDTYHTAIGQYSMQVTPIEEARAIAAIANGGKLMTPTLVKGAAPSGESIAVSQDALQVVREGMRMGVTGGGTSAGLNDLSFVQLAGKTGTAQLGAHNEYYNAWAVGFWPYSDPKYVYVVVMEHGPSGNSTGGIYVMHEFLSKLHQVAPEYFQ
jgi:penicillin-binding protein 2